MKRVFFVGVLAVVLSAGRASASPIVINFDGYADDTFLPVGTFDGIGIHFDQKLVANDGDFGDLPQSLPNAAFNAETFAGSITGTFLGPLAAGVGFISVFAGDSGGDVDTVTLNGYNAANVLVDSDTFADTTAHTLSISGSGIVRFEILETGAIAIDDFTVEAAAVPEPASLLLLGSGLIAAVRNLRKRQTF